MADQFFDIVDPASDVLDGFWLPLYRAAFPDDERVPEEEHRVAVASDNQHLLVGFDGDQPVSMARFDIVDESPVGPYGYLMYMAVAPDAVSRGHGQQMFGEVLRRMASHPAVPRFLLFEVQRPDLDHSTEPHQSADRRIAFYDRLGARILDGADYVQSVPGQPGVPMLLMVRPVADDVTPEEAFGAAAMLFGDDVSQRGPLLFAMAGDGS